MRGICEPEAESRKNLAVILAHGREDPERGEDAIENKEREYRIARRWVPGDGTGTSHYRRLRSIMKFFGSHREPTRRRKTPLMITIRTAKRMANAPAYE